MSLYKYVSNIENIIVEIGKEMSKSELTTVKKLFANANFDPKQLSSLLPVTLEYIGKTPKARQSFIAKQKDQIVIRIYAIYILARAYEAAEISEDIVSNIGASYRSFAQYAANISSRLSHEDFCLKAYRLLAEYC